MWHATCTTNDCTENGVDKRPLGDDPVPDEVLCGVCLNDCRITVEQPAGT